MKPTREQYRIEQERVAVERGLELISHELVNDAKLYRFVACGHEKRIQVGHVRNGTFKCRVCQVKNYSNLCKEHGIEIIGEADNGDANYKKIKFKDCGHERLATLQSAKIGTVLCTVCQEARFKENAVNSGCKFIGGAEDHRYGVYELPCGHSNVVQHGNIKRSIFRCVECKSSYKTRKSYVYIVKLRSLNFEFIKIGFAAHPARRLKSMLKEGTTFEILDVLEFESGIEANKYETNLHTALQHHRVKSKITKQLLKSGWTECFYLSVLEELCIADLFVHLGEKYVKPLN